MTREEGHKLNFLKTCKDKKSRMSCVMCGCSHFLRAKHILGTLGLLFSNVQLRRVYDLCQRNVEK